MSSVTIVDDMKKIFTSRAVIAIQNAEPSHPTVGDMYILGSSPSGTNWNGQNSDDFALYNGVNWVFFTPIRYSIVYLISASKLYIKNSSWDVL